MQYSFAFPQKIYYNHRIFPISSLEWVSTILLYRTRKNMADNVMDQIINKANLIPNKRKGVIYFDNLGDWYSLCRSVLYAESVLNTEYVLLYFSEKHDIILNWFIDENPINFCRITAKEWTEIRSASFEDKCKYQDYFVWWSIGDEEFRKLTQNISPQYSSVLLTPKFRKFDCEKYSNIIEKK